MWNAVTPEIVARSADVLLATSVVEVVELAPHGTLRTFRARGNGHTLTLRVDEDPASASTATEALVLNTIGSAIDPPIAPVVRACTRVYGRDGIERTLLAYDWMEGSTLDARSAALRARDVGATFASLHGARVMDLDDSLPSSPRTLMDAYRQTADELRAWMLAREGDGLGQDLLTLALSDLLRALRAFVIARDHVFVTRRRRSLCHGQASPVFTVARPAGTPVLSPVALVGLERAHLGDAAGDLASFAVAASLDDDAEDRLLQGYLARADELGRLDRLFVPRYFARRALTLLSVPIARLDRIAKRKRGAIPALLDPVVELEAEAALACEEIARAMNGLRDLSGRARPITAREVSSMGRVVTLEEMLLADRTFRIALSGQPYAGKTEVGAMLARRLQHAFFGTAALSRALALVERQRAESGEPPWRPRELVAALFARGFRVVPDPELPFYRALLGDDDVTAQLRDPGEGGSNELKLRGADLLDDDAMRAAIRDHLEKHFAGAGIVMEGVYAAQLLPGRVHAFHLVGDAAVRRARLMGHRPDLVDEDEAGALLARLDAMQPKVTPDAIHVDVGSRTAAGASLEVLSRLVPPGRRHAPDLAGRPPL